MTHFAELTKRYKFTVMISRCDRERSEWRGGVGNKCDLIWLRLREISFASPIGITNLFSLAVDLKLRTISNFDFQLQRVCSCSLSSHIMYQSFSTNECRRQDFVIENDSDSQK